MKKLILPLFLFGFIALSYTQTPGTLTVTTTTSTPGSNVGFDPKNVLAIWVQNSAGTMINTLLYNTKNGNESGMYLTTWYDLIESWTARTTYTDVDAVTSATNTSYGAKTCYWGKTVNISTVPDGVYTLKMEIACDGVSVGTSGHKIVAYTFTKGPANSIGVVSGATSSSFSNVDIQWVPSNTAIDEVKLANLYSVYPNPTKSTVFISGVDIKEIELCDLSGKSIFTSHEQKLDLKKLAKGTYLAKIKTAKGTFIKKIRKE